MEEEPQNKDILSGNSRMFFPVKETDPYIVKLIKNVLFYTIAGIMLIATLLLFATVLVVV